MTAAEQNVRQEDNRNTVEEIIRDLGVHDAGIKAVIKLNPSQGSQEKQDTRLRLLRVVLHTEEQKQNILQQNGNLHTMAVPMRRNFTTVPHHAFKERQESPYTAD